MIGRKQTYFAAFSPVMACLKDAKSQFPLNMALYGLVEKLTFSGNDSRPQGTLGPGLGDNLVIMEVGCYQMGAGLDNKPTPPKWSTWSPTLVLSVPNVLSPAILDKLMGAPHSTATADI